MLKNDCVQRASSLCTCHGREKQTELLERGMGREGGESSV